MLNESKRSYIMKVCVAVDHKWCDDYRDYIVAWFLEDNKLTSKSDWAWQLGGVERLDNVVVDATEEQIALAAEIYRDTKREVSEEYYQCQVNIKRSQKVKDGVYDVQGFRPRQWNGRFYTQEQIMVNDTWISSSCIEAVVKGCYPWWK